MKYVYPCPACTAVLSWTTAMTICPVCETPLFSARRDLSPQERQRFLDAQFADADCSAGYPKGMIAKSDAVAQ